MKYRGHYFVSYGKEESMCRMCGFIIWPTSSEEDIEIMFNTNGILSSKCPKVWHGFKYKK